MALPGRQVVSLSESGHRCGESHPKARLTNAQVDEIRELREAHGLSYKTIAQHFGVSWNTIRSICAYHSRAVTPFQFRSLVNN